MKSDHKILLKDILYSIERIEKASKKLSFYQFQENIDAQDIIIRRLSIIGEAANKVPKEIQDGHKEINWHDLIGMRNVLIHEYFDVNMKVLWDTIENDLPRLKSQIQKLLKD